MTATLGALLETIAVLGVIAAGASLLVPPLIAAVRRLPVAPAVRADLALTAAALPALAVVVAAVAVVLPGAFDLLGIVPDHCNEHGGHGHLCLAHPAVASPAIVAVGAMVAAVTVFRAANWSAERTLAARDLWALLRLGRPASAGADVVQVDGDALLCHAAGAFSPRILVSTRVMAGLSPEQLAAALDHERAHVRRRDVFARDLLAVLGLFALPGVLAAAAKHWEEAAEEAADAAAATRHGGVAVASALVAVARMSLAPVPAAIPLVRTQLTRRVRLLLDQPPRHRPALALAAIPAFAVLVLCVAVRLADPLHHATETVLSRVLLLLG